MAGLHSNMVSESVCGILNSHENDHRMLPKIWVPKFSVKLSFRIRHSKSSSYWVAPLLKYHPARSDKLHSSTSRTSPGNGNCRDDLTDKHGGFGGIFEQEDGDMFAKNLGGSEEKYYGRCSKKLDWPWVYEGQSEGIKMNSNEDFLMDHWITYKATNMGWPWYLLNISDVCRVDMGSLGMISIPRVPIPDSVQWRDTFLWPFFWGTSAWWQIQDLRTIKILSKRSSKASDVVWTPLKNMKVNWEDYSQDMENKTCSKLQPNIYSDY